MTNEEKEKLLRSFFPMLKNSIKKLLYNQHLHDYYDDCESVGLLAAYDAIGQYDESYNTKLETYIITKCLWAVKSEMRRLRALEGIYKTNTYFSINYYGDHNSFIIDEYPSRYNTLDDLENDDHYYGTREKVCSLMSVLSPIEKVVISHYFWDNLNLKTIGELVDLTESRVHQIKTHAIDKMRCAA